LGSKVRTSSPSDSCTSSLPPQTFAPVPVDEPEPSESPERTSPAMSDEVPSTNARAAAGSSKDSLKSFFGAADASSAAKRAGEAPGGARRRPSRRDLAAILFVDL